MRFQFSVLTMLVCTAALAVTIAACVSLQVRTGDVLITDIMGLTYEPKRLPSGSEIALRMAWAAPLAIAATLTVLWTARKLRTW
jgi:hypothetical protein